MPSARSIASRAPRCRLVLLGTDSCDELFTLGAGCLRSRSAGTSCLGTWGDFGTLEKPFSAHRYKDIGKRLSQATLAHRGDLEVQRRLLYNAVTRAQKAATIIVQDPKGGRTIAAPFA